MSETLFDPLEDGRSAPPRLDPPRPKPLEDDGSPSPFGSALPKGYVRSEGLDEEEGDSLGVVRFLTAGLGDQERAPLQKAKRYDPRDHYKRTYAALERLYPGSFFWRADYTQTTYSGQIITKDTLGFADVMGMLPGGRIVAVQVTSYGAIKAHLRKYTDPAKTHGPGANAPSIESLLRRFLATGGRVLIFGFALPEGRRTWEHEIVEITPELLDGYVARKRGKR